MKKLSRILLMLFFFLGITVLLFAQDSTGTGDGGGGGIVLGDKLILVLTAVLAIYEVIARLFPTVNNISIIGWLIKLIQVILPNRKAGTTPAAEIKEAVIEAKTTHD